MNVATVAALHNLKAVAAAAAAAAAAAVRGLLRFTMPTPSHLSVQSHGTEGRLLTMVRVVVGLIGGILEGDMWSKIPPMSRQWTWR